MNKNNFVFKHPIATATVLTFITIIVFCVAYININDKIANIKYSQRTVSSEPSFEQLAAKDGWNKVCTLNKTIEHHKLVEPHNYYEDEECKSSLIPPLARHNIYPFFSFEYNSTRYGFGYGGGDLLDGYTKTNGTTEEDIIHISKEEFDKAWSEFCVQRKVEALGEPAIVTEPYILYWNETKCKTHALAKEEEN